MAFSLPSPSSLLKLPYKCRRETGNQIGKTRKPQRIVDPKNRLYFDRKQPKIRPAKKWKNHKPKFLDVKTEKPT